MLKDIVQDVIFFLVFILVACALITLASIKRLSSCAHTMFPLGSGQQTLVMRPSWP